MRIISDLYIIILNGLKVFAHLEYALINKSS